MCKCCQECLETCWWNLIEERFCFDESIATYQDPIVKDEKNNNFSDNMTFYDSVAVIAGRAIVTIDPLPKKQVQQAITAQPRSQNTLGDKSKNQTSMPNIPTLSVFNVDDSVINGDYNDEKTVPKKTVSFNDITTTNTDTLFKDTSAASQPTFLETPQQDNTGQRKKSLMERRQSKSLHLNLDFQKDMPIIRQTSVPKFFLESPESNQAQSSLIKTPLESLQSPLIKEGFHYDLKSVVQMEKMNIHEKEREIKDSKEKKNIALVHKESASHKFANIKDKIMLKKSKSTVSSSSIPHTNHI